MSAMAPSRPAVLGVRLAALVALAGLLEALVRTGLVSRFIVAPPSSLPAAFARLWRDGDLLAPVLTTFGEAAAATLLAAAIGLPLGWLLWRRPVLGTAYEPWIGAAFAAPIVLLYPLLLVIFGRGAATIVFIGVVSATIPITLKMREGLLGVRPVLVQVGRSFHLAQSALFLRIIAPAAAPTIFIGLRLGLIYGLVNIIGIEFLIDAGGLGRVVSETYFTFEVPAMYAAILLIVAVSLVLLAGLDRCERWLRRR
jgi:NitT/TauT family transport system permease protein